jgi:hypothetical protein
MDTGTLITVGIALPVSIVALWIDFEDTHTLNILRAVFLFVQAVSFVGSYLLSLRIKQNRDSTRINAPVYSFLKSSTRTETLTIQEYDLREWRSLFREQLVILVAAVFVHIYSRMNVPLAVLLVVSPFRLIWHPLSQIYFLGKSGPELQRPFKSEDHLATIMDQVKELQGKDTGKRKKKLKRPSERTLEKLRADIKANETNDTTSK